MNIEFTKSFEKQIDRIKILSQKTGIAKVVENVMEANSLRDIHNIKKGHSLNRAYQ